MITARIVGHAAYVGWWVFAVVFYAIARSQGWV